MDICGVYVVYACIHLTHMVCLLHRGWSSPLLWVAVILELTICCCRARLLEWDPEGHSDCNGPLHVPHYQQGNETTRKGWIDEDERLDISTHPALIQNSTIWNNKSLPKISSSWIKKKKKFFSATVLTAQTSHLKLSLLRSESVSRSSC